MKEMLTSSAREKLPPKVLSHIEVKQAENGGAITEHHFTHYEHKAEPHVFGASEGKELAAHVLQHMGMKKDVVPEEKEPAAEHES